MSPSGHSSPSSGIYPKAVATPTVHLMVGHNQLSSQRSAPPLGGGVYGNNGTVRGQAPQPPNDQVHQNPAFDDDEGIAESGL